MKVEHKKWSEVLKRGVNGACRGRGELISNDEQFGRTG
jgi:hypothetical protein